MAKTPSVESEIETARAAAAELRVAETGLLEQLSAFHKAQDMRAADRHEADGQAFDALKARKDSAEKALANLVLRLSSEIDAAYHGFEAASERTAYENFVAFFSKSKAAKLQNARLRKAATAQTLKQLLINGDAVAEILAREKAAALDLQKLCEPPLIALMQRRRELAASIEEGRHRLKEVNATLATVQWKLGSVTDETRRTTMEAEREALSLDLEKHESAYQTLRSGHESLDRYVLLHEAFAQGATHQLSAHSLLYNKLAAEMERGIQLYAAVSLSLETLLSEISRKASHPHLAELLTIHAHNTISMDDIVRRKQQIDEAFMRRYIVEKGRVAAIANTP
ncbi:hypothetical protein [uncultured Agrobacterium sp.]|uniref:hypothetical protein n=1 Tax=uncultured Agrobacterium sp. TaxID=157277 RepID=UPI0025898467|nr:hypothetical protein [uncultured Agrobacterium sp.]